MALIMHNRASDLLRQARERGDHTAIIHEGRRISFSDLAEDIFRIAGGLAQLGIRAGTRVGLMIPSQPEFVTSQQALFLLGAVVSPLNIFYRPNEVVHAVKSCELEFVITIAALLDRLPLSTRSQMPSLRTVIVADDAEGLDGFTSLIDAINHASPIREATALDPNSLAILLHTSATTGKSKGVMLTTGNLAANYDATPTWLGLTSDDIILCALPLYNTFGLNQCINAMTHCGATLIIAPRFDAERCIELIRHYRCTFMPAVPTMLQKIVDHPGLEPGMLASLRRVMTGGAPVPAPLLARILAATGEEAEIFTGYGLTEATALVTLTTVTLDGNGQVKRGRTIGRVLDGMELAVADDNGQRLAAGETGEFIMRGPNVMAGYYHASEDTAAALKDGWLHSGDIGFIDDEGFAFIVDRKKDVIIRGGQNIYPADIEEILYADAAVAEAAVIGIAEPLLGEVPVAFVAARAGQQISIEALAARCRENLAAYKQPHAIHVMEELPKGPTGKILRRQLRDSAMT